MKFLLVLTMLFAFESGLAAKKPKSTTKSPHQIIGVLISKSKIPSDEKSAIDNMLLHRWTIHKQGLQLQEAPTNSLAFDIGLKLGDVLISVNDHPMHMTQAIMVGMNSIREEQKCVLIVFRDKKYIQFNVSAK